MWPNCQTVLYQGMKYYQNLYSSCLNKKNALQSSTFLLVFHPKSYLRTIELSHPVYYLWCFFVQTILFLYLGVDADASRREEENRMMEDANKWLSATNNGEVLEEDKHAKTGATALHVAAAKGYGKVMRYNTMHRWKQWKWNKC